MTTEKLFHTNFGMPLSLRTRLEKIRIARAHKHKDSLIPPLKELLVEAVESFCAREEKRNP